MESNPIDQLDSVTRNIPSAKVREACGNPADQAWAKYRAECGIGKKVKFLSLYESVVMFIRADWRQTCKDINWQYIQRPTAVQMYKAARLLFSSGKQSRLLARTQSLDALASQGNKTWKDVQEMVAETLGKPLSERSLGRICEKLKLTKFTRLRTFSKTETLLISREAIRRQESRQQQKR